MYIRKCPKCDNGKMLAVSMVRGWGKEYHYVCNSCGHDKWIYEGNPNIGESYEKSKKSFWIVLILIEIIIFFNDNIISGIDYIIYLSLLILFIYNLFTPNKLKLGYEIVASIDAITPEEAKEELMLNYSIKDNKVMLFIGVIILSVIATDYFDNWYLLGFALLSFILMYYYGFLDISTHRRGKFFRDKKFEKDINDLVVKVDSSGKPIY